MKLLTPETTQEKRICNAIDEFSALMKDKMIRKARLGARGWDNPQRYPNVYGQLVRAVGNQIESHQEVDIANLAFILHFMKGGDYNS